MAENNFDIVVVGGGLAGMCAAIAAARHGARVALVHDRPVFGGNASSEIKMHVCGADIHGSKPNVRETGIVEELLLKNRLRNPQHSFSVQDCVFEEVLRAEKNLTLYLNTHITEAKTRDGRIASVSGFQQQTEKAFRFTAPLFVDATGDGTVGFMAGAEYMYGTEGRDVFDEPSAPEKSNRNVMGNSLMFTARDMGRPVSFVKPSWAYTYTENDLRFRDHGQITSGYWWIEAADNDDIIGRGDNVREELQKMLFGVWDHIKNGGDHGAENYALDWIGALPGKRESRRLVGDYVLTENDLTAGRRFFDAVAYGGWNMDMHTAGGMVTTEKDPTTYISTDAVYQIPYRALYSKNIDNLFMAGRDISASHLAFGSTRVMATCAVVGQAVGTAAAMCVRDAILPRSVTENIEVLQRQLVRDDCYIPNLSLSDPDDRALTATVHTDEGAATAQYLTDGVYRNEGGAPHAFVTETAKPQSVTLTFDKPFAVNEVVLRFDSDLTAEWTITISDEIRARQRAFPTELIKDYNVVFRLKGNPVKRVEVRDNDIRLNKIAGDGVCADELTLKLLSNYGAPRFHIFGINVY